MNALNVSNFSNPHPSTSYNPNINNNIPNNSILVQNPPTSLSNNINANLNTQKQEHAMFDLPEVPKQQGKYIIFILIMIVIVQLLILFIYLFNIFVVKKEPLNYNMNFDVENDIHFDKPNISPPKGKNNYNNIILILYF